MGFSKLMGVAMAPDLLAESAKTTDWSLRCTRRTAGRLGGVDGLSNACRPHDNDIISAMYGDDELPLLIGTIRRFIRIPSRVKCSVPK